MEENNNQTNMESNTFSPEPYQTPSPVDNTVNNTMSNNQEQMNSQQMNESVPPQMEPTPMPSNAYSTTPTPAPENKNNKTLFIIIIAVVVVVVAVVLILVLGKDKKPDPILDYEDEIKAEEKVEEELNKHYSLKEYTLQDKDILLEFENKNDVCVDANIKVEFYDESDNLVNTEEELLLGVEPNSKRYESIYISSDDINYNSYKAKAYLTKSYSDSRGKSNVEIISKNVVEGSILIQVKNNSSTKYSYISVYVLFYDESGNIIDYGTTTYANVTAGETASSKVTIPYDDNFDYIKYSKYDVIVNSVSS